MPGTLTLHISASSAISDVDNVVVSAEPVAFEGRLKLCEFGRSPANRDVDTTAPKFFQLRGNQLLMGDSASSLNVFCVLNSGYLIRDQPDSIISIFKPGKTKISLQAPSPDEAKQWVTHMRKALIGYRIDKTILESRIQQQAMVKKAMETSRELDDVVVDDDDDDEDTDDDADDGLESAPAADATGCNSSEMVSWQGTWHGPALKGGMRTGLGLYRLGSIVYEGEWDRDMMHGQGQMFDEKTGVRYNGKWQNNCQHGRGEVEFANGDKYNGMLFHGRIMGYGVLTQKVTIDPATGKHLPFHQYRGEFVDGVPTGHGRMTWANGDVYEGRFRDGVGHGRGRLTYATVGQVHTGCWHKGVLEYGEIQFTATGNVYRGQIQTKPGDVTSGTLIYKDGGAYEGTVAGESRHGTGKMTWSNGDQYEGSWANDTMHGFGTLVRSDQSRYSGYFSKSRRSGVGEFVFGKRSYNGTWNDDLPNGTGVIMFANGNKYSGVWKAGKRTGVGRFTFARNKAVIDGEFLDGKPHGQATFALEDGRCFKGTFAGYMRIGKGTIVLPDGRARVSQFVDDREVDGSQLHGHLVEEIALDDDIDDKPDDIVLSSGKKQHRAPSEDELSLKGDADVDDVGVDIPDFFDFSAGIHARPISVDGFDIFPVDEIDCPFVKPVA
ncbi:unnamed protein product (mitochondrion) [Plasmodiophora brassicae]|uniref:PH domain-containing protein n=2 Tax=Plasmodiophora brassicae TaxID=37360 RepID=A0A3P3Y9C8_PLABS|nr:unnamed protein product [Plasmodiophora brassicae]